MATDSPNSAPDTGGALTSAAVTVNRDGSVWDGSVQKGWVDQQSVTVKDGKVTINPGKALNIDVQGGILSITAPGSNTIHGVINMNFDMASGGYDPGAGSMMNGDPIRFPGYARYVLQGSGAYHSEILPGGTIRFIAMNRSKPLSTATWNHDGIYWGGLRVLPDVKNSNTPIGPTARYGFNVPVRFGWDGLYLTMTGERIAPANIDTNNQWGIGAGQQTVQASNLPSLVGINALTTNWRGPDGGVTGARQLAHDATLSPVVLAYGYTEDMTAAFMITGLGGVYKAWISGGLRRVDYLGDINAMPARLGLWLVPLVQGNQQDQPQAGVWSPSEGAR